MTERPKVLFEDLGKPTLRGVRKCPKCGTFNGTRGVSCKNKECKLVFKATKEKLKESEALKINGERNLQIYSEPDAVKINSERNLQIYSVKLNEGSEDSRSFVHLPIIEGIETLQDATEVKIIKRTAAVCYASSCHKPMEDISTITLNLNPCSHTEYVVSCSEDAKPMIFKKVILKVMPISEDIKEKIRSLTVKSNDPLVQRVSKNTLVIRCNPDEQHPLGLLHFSLFEPQKSSKKFRMLCDCQSEFTKPFVPKEKQMCMHFYMCICALASDSTLIEEFKPLIQAVFFHKPTGAISVSLTEREINPSLKILKDFLPEDFFPPTKKIKTEILGSMEMIPSLTFDQWLGSITEKINQTMHYQFDGHPEPLVFQAPQVFFDILQQRMSTGSKKKRLPNSVVAFTRKDSLPLGVFSKYIWHITNILHLKQIFDTPDISLEVTRSFTQNRDGTYTYYEPPPHEKIDPAENFRKTVNTLFIKPLEFKTFLKVGTMSQDQKQPIPFIVEWIPDVLPKSHVGELRIKFEYGHQRNGVIENRSVADNITESQSKKGEKL